MKSIKKVLHMTVLLSLVAASLAWTTHPVQAVADIYVTTSTDEDGTSYRPYTSKCSLREAVISANENISYGGCTKGTPGMDVIHVPFSSTPYVLNATGPEDDAARGGDLDIREPVEIVGFGEHFPTISGNSTSRVFHVLTSGAVIFRALVITGGYNADRGSGIYIDRSNVPYTPQVTISNVILNGNQASAAGGGLFISTGATAYVSFSEISNNTARQAGGISNEGTLYLDSSLILSNQGVETTGGISATSLSANEKTRVVNSTIAGNTAPSGSGAGLSVSSFQRLELLNDTIVDNQGLGLELKDKSIVSVKNTIIGRQVGSNNCKLSGSYTFDSLGYNLTTDSTCVFDDPMDLPPVTSAGLLLSALGDNGGPTRTYKPDPESPAVDAGDNTDCPVTDQRRYFRPTIGRTSGGSLTCDIGSVEVGEWSGVQVFIPFTRR